MSTSEISFNIFLALVGIIAGIVAIFIPKSRLKRVAITLSALAFIVLAFGIGFEIGKKAPTQETTYTVSVSTAGYPFSSTGILIEKGDDVEIIVQGDDASWICNADTMPPYEHYPATAEGRAGTEGNNNLVPDARDCELVGYIQSESYFRVGAYERLIAPESGVLYLGANDWTTCEWDCYSDNIGALIVKVVVRK